MNEAHLKEIFREYGNVLRAFYPKNNRKYTIRRFGLVEFEKRSEAKKAIMYMNEGWINGREVLVRFAVQGEGEDPLPEPVTEKSASRMAGSKHNRISPVRSRSRSKGQSER